MINIFKSLSDPYRQEILKLLNNQEMAVCEIINSVELSQPAISHHLKILKQANLIKSEKKGKIVFYSLNKEGLKEFFYQTLGFLNALSFFTESTIQASPLRENPNHCSNLVSKPSICEKEI